MNFFMYLLNEWEDKRNEEVDFSNQALQLNLYTLAADGEESKQEEGFVYYHILL